MQTVSFIVNVRTEAAEIISPASSASSYRSMSAGVAMQTAFATPVARQDTKANTVRATDKPAGRRCDLPP